MYVYFFEYVFHYISTPRLKFLNSIKTTTIKVLTSKHLLQPELKNPAHVRVDKRISHIVNEVEIKHQVVPRDHVILHQPRREKGDDEDHSYSKHHHRRLHVRHTIILPESHQLARFARLENRSTKSGGAGFVHQSVDEQIDDDNNPQTGGVQSVVDVLEHAKEGFVQERHKEVALAQVDVLTPRGVQDAVGEEEEGLVTTL